MVVDLLHRLTQSLHIRDDVAGGHIRLASAVVQQTLQGVCAGVETFRNCGERALRHILYDLICSGKLYSLNTLV